MTPSRRPILSGTAACLFGIGGRRRQFLRPEAAEHISAKLQDRNLTVRITAGKVWAALAKN